MLLLAIETSCDDSGLALLELDPTTQSIQLKAERLHSQIDIHKEYGGVVPEIAARSHLTALPLLFDEICNSAGIKQEDIEGIAVTQGPGLKGCLLMGISFAKGLSTGLGVPLFGAHHIEGHILSAMLDDESLEPPFLALVVSGGHTEIVLVEAIGRYRLICRTIDDAAGEAFDKSANLLGFVYPGGAALSALADTVEESQFVLPRVMRESDGFSFSGLKTAIALLIKRQSDTVESMDAGIRAELAHAIQEAIVDALCFKLSQAIESTGINRVALVGGVAANRRLRAAVTAITDVCSIPKMEHCTDNAAMIGFATLARIKASCSPYQAGEVQARWPVVTEHD